MKPHSDYIAQAKAQIAAVRGKSLSEQERCQGAIVLATLLLKEAHQSITPDEFLHQAQLNRMMVDPIGKAFAAAVTDQCFRSKDLARAASQLVYTLNIFGIPRFFSWDKRMALQAVRHLGTVWPSLTMPLTRKMIRKETEKVILPGEHDLLIKHLHRRQKEGVRVNLNHLGEAILGEEEALKRLQVYLDDLKRPEIDYISIKISTLYSQLNLLARNHTLHILKERLRLLYRACLENHHKFVNLDMEEYRDLYLTVDLFQQVLDEPEFRTLSAGIVLQSYLPDSFLLQQELTAWAKERVAKGGAPIKIRIVKGANLAMERVEASLKGWPQAPYLTKAEVDANFKKMVIYGCEPANAAAAWLGIGSHNLFDLAFALLLRAENNIDKFICVEMLEGMAEPMRRAVQSVAGDMLLYCPVAAHEEFQYAVAYLVRRLDENTAPENFLRHAFGMEPGGDAWNNQEKLFSLACEQASNVSTSPRRQQNRFTEPPQATGKEAFKNEPDTDWSLPHHRLWAEEILATWSKKTIDTIPLVVGGKRVLQGMGVGTGIDPSFPKQPFYDYTLASEDNVEEALSTAVQAAKSWSSTSVKERSQVLAQIAQGLRRHRADLIGAMVADTGKTIGEADGEVSEAIDFAEYYRHSLEELTQLQDIEWKSKGVVLVTPPWNFPCSIPAGGILAALAAGNSVIFKPAPEAILVGWILVQVFWQAGIGLDLLQFIACEDEPIGSRLIQDPRIACVVLTGATATARLFMKLRPGLDLAAETGGKNAMIITAMSDRDLAIKDLIQSAFGHAGQKCSACSLAICEAEVYDDSHFRRALRDAAASLYVGSAWDLATRVNPLIREPNPVLLQALTTLEPGEEWLLEPVVDGVNPHLWSPGIKWGVKPGSLTYQHELFGPVLGVMRAENLEHAIALANGTPYGLTSGLHSLDEREHRYWIEHIEAGNCYINRGITGAIVQRQPFGGCKQSSFGRGAKAGGPNYVMQLMHPVEKSSPDSYEYYWRTYFSQDHDPSRLLGQDNILRYVPHRQQTLRVQPQDDPLDVQRLRTAAAVCGAALEVSEKESEEDLIKKIMQGKISRLRCLSQPSATLVQAAADAGVNLIIAPVMANGRVELLTLLREVSLSIDYHRYGYLGLRENSGF